MAYIGSEPNYGTIASQRFTGDGSTTAFGLTQTAPNDANTAWCQVAGDLA